MDITGCLEVSKFNRQVSFADEEVLMRGALEALIRSIGCRVAMRQEGGTSQSRQRYATLSLRERQVMAFVVQGLLNKLIAAELGISEITVKAHRGKMMRKMGASSVPELVIIAAGLSLASTMECRSQAEPPSLAAAF
jgi:DNA-binding NarL/FixJ family response regulator